MIGIGQRRWWCLYCGENLPKGFKEVGRTYCSNKCSALDRSAKRRAKLGNVTCHYDECGKSFLPSQTNHTKRASMFCSDTCRQASLKKSWRLSSAKRYHTCASYREGQRIYSQNYRERVRANAKPAGDAADAG